MTCSTDMSVSFRHVLGPGSKHLAHRHFAQPIYGFDDPVPGMVLAGVAMKADPFAVLSAGQSFLAAPEIDQVIGIDQCRG
jgi:hypothetical protein